MPEFSETDFLVGPLVSFDGTCLVFIYIWEIGSNISMGKFRAHHLYLCCVAVFVSCFIRNKQFTLHCHWRQRGVFCCCCFVFFRGE